MQHSRIGRCAVSTRDLMNNTHARLVRVLFRHWHFCSVDCALHEECIAPKGAQLYHCSPNTPQEVDYCGCHRFDQSALNIILTQEFGKEVYKTVFENNNTFEVKYAHNKNCIPLNTVTVVLLN